MANISVLVTDGNNIAVEVTPVPTQVITIDRGIAGPVGPPGPAGSVTSVALTAPALFSVAGSPITTSGTLALTYSGTALPVANGGTNSTTAQTAINTLAGAVTSAQYLRGNGTNVVMSAIQAADVPTLNQNTTGTAANVTGTVAVANGGTGLTTIAARSIPVANALNTYTSVTPAAGQSIRINAGNTAWEAYTPTAGGSGTVTSVGLSAPALFTVTGSPVTTSGTLALSYSGTALPVANGGTALTSYTANGVLYASGTTTLASGSVLTFNGSTLGVNGVSIGRGAGAVATNTAIGTSTLNVNTTGDLNTAVGVGAMAGNITGSSNTAIGYRALEANSVGNFNTAVGRQVLLSATSSSNTGLGYRAMDGITSGAQNTATGDRALFSNLTGSNNAAYGYFALNASTGGSNAAFGTNAGSGITTGANNTIIGSYTGGAAPISATGSNFIVLSDGAGNVRLYSDASGNVNVPSLTASKAVFTDASKNLTTTGTLGVAQGGTGVTTSTGTVNVVLSNAPAITNPTFTGYTETVYSTYTTALNPANGTIQRFALTGNTTFTDSLASGQSITLMIDDGTAFTVTWPTMNWVGGAAPALATTGYTVIEIWKVSTTLYGALVGTVA